MEGNMVSLVEVKKSKEHVLYNLLQKYLYEMSQYYDDTMDEDGNFKYEYLSYYFTDPNRSAYFIYDENIMIGFVMVNDNSFTDEPIENCIAEFTIFPAFRHSGKAKKTIAALKKLRKGKWQLKYSRKNVSAANFWQKIKILYHGAEQPLGESEVAVTFE